MSKDETLRSRIEKALYDGANFTQSNGSSDDDRTSYSDNYSPNNLKSIVLSQEGVILSFFTTSSNQNRLVRRVKFPQNQVTYDELNEGKEVLSFLVGRRVYTSLEEITVISSTGDNPLFSLPPRQIDFIQKNLMQRLLRLKNVIVVKPIATSLEEFEDYYKQDLSKGLLSDNSDFEGNNGGAKVVPIQPEWYNSINLRPAYYKIDESDTDLYKKLYAERDYQVALAKGDNPDGLDGDVEDAQESISAGGTDELDSDTIDTLDLIGKYAKLQQVLSNRSSSASDSYDFKTSTVTKAVQAKTAFQLLGLTNYFNEDFLTNNPQYTDIVKYVNSLKSDNSTEIEPADAAKIAENLYNNLVFFNLKLIYSSDNSSSSNDSNDSDKSDKVGLALSIFLKKILKTDKFADLRNYLSQGGFYLSDKALMNLTNLLAPNSKQFRQLATTNSKVSLEDTLLTELKAVPTDKDFDKSLYEYISDLTQIEQGLQTKDDPTMMSDLIVLHDYFLTKNPTEGISFYNHSLAGSSTSKGYMDSAQVVEDLKALTASTDQHEENQVPKTLKPSTSNGSNLIRPGEDYKPDEFEINPSNKYGLLDDNPDLIIPIDKDEELIDDKKNQEDYEEEQGREADADNEDMNKHASDKNNKADDSVNKYTYWLNRLSTVLTEPRLNMAVQSGGTFIEPMVSDLQEIILDNEPETLDADMTELLISTEMGYLANSTDDNLDIYLDMKQPYFETIKTVEPLNSRDMSLPNGFDYYYNLHGTSVKPKDTYMYLQTLYYIMKGRIR